MYVDLSLRILFCISLNRPFECVLGFLCSGVVRKNVGLNSMWIWIWKKKCVIIMVNGGVILMVKYIEIEVLCILVLLEYMFKSSTLTRMNHPKNWVVGCYLHLYDRQNSPTFIYVIPVKTNTDQLPGCDFMSNTGVPDYGFMLPDQHSVIKSLWKHYDKNECAYICIRIMFSNKMWLQFVLCEP